MRYAKNINDSWQELILQENEYHTVPTIETYKSEIDSIFKIKLNESEIEFFKKNKIKIEILPYKKENYQKVLDFLEKSNWLKLKVSELNLRDYEMVEAVSYIPYEDRKACNKNFVIGKKYTLLEYKELKIKELESKSFREMNEKYPSWKLTNASLGIYSEEVANAIRNKINNHRKIYDTIKMKINSSSDYEEIRSLVENVNWNTTIQ